MLTRMARLLPLLVVSACATEPSQTSRHVSDPGAASNGKIYALPRGLVTVSVKTETTTDKGTGASATKITIDPPTVAYYPDARARFEATWAESSWATDHFTFQTDQDGLLTSNSIVNKDETAQIIGKVIDIAKEAAKAAAQYSLDGAGGPPETPEKQEPPCRNGSAVIQFDPFTQIGSGRKPGARSTQSIRFNGRSCFSVTAEGIGGGPVSTITNEEVADIARTCTGGVCARLPVPVKIVVRGNKGTAVENASAEFVTVLPDPGTIVSYDILRGPCIQRQTDFAFSKGMLTRVELQKPSEILGCLDIPLNVVKGIGEIPSSFLQAKINVINSDTGLVNAQAQYLQAITTLMNNQNTLLKAVAAK